MVLETLIWDLQAPLSYRLLPWWMNQLSEAQMESVHMTTEVLTCKSFEVHTWIRTCWDASNRGARYVTLPIPSASRAQLCYKASKDSNPSHTGAQLKQFI